MAASDSSELLTVHERIELFIEALPILVDDELASLTEDTCPICLMPFAALNDPNTRGLITKLTECGHAFCRKDLTEWIRGQHGSCPTCRHKFLNIAPRSESDDESSDGGEYMPPSDDFEDEDDGFLDTDGFTDAEAQDEAERTYYTWIDEEGLYPLEDSEAGPPYDVENAGHIYEESVVEDANPTYDEGPALYEVDEEDLDMEEDSYEEWGLTEGDSGSMSDGTSFEADCELDFAPDLVQSIDGKHDDGIRLLDYNSESK